MMLFPYKEKRAALRVALVALHEALTIRGYHRKLTPLQRVVERAAGRFFRAQGLAYGRVLDAAFNLREAQIDASADQLFDSAVVGVDIGTLARAIGSCYVSGAIAGIAEHNLGIRFDLTHPRAVAYFQARGLELLRELNDTTRAEIRAIIQRGIEAGTDPHTLAREIKGRFVSYAAKTRGKRSRAELVAVTEVGRAYQAGNYAAIDEATIGGLDFEKSWSLEPDACPICRGNADQDWIAYGSLFQSGAQYPPAHPGCRCAALYRRKV